MISELFLKYYIMSVKPVIISSLLSLILLSCSPKKAEWHELFNGKDLSGWDTYLGPKYDTLLNKSDSLPIGLNTDPAGVFSVVKMGDQNVIRISGENFGGISTVSEYQNYHLQLEFKWGQLKWAPRKKDKRDSGLMYHSVGPDGADGGYWRRSHEFQIEEGDCGDYWACAGALSDIRAKKETNGSYIYDPGSDFVTFALDSPAGRNCIKFPDAEKLSGEWNTLDLYCFGTTSIHVVNGKVNMVLTNSRQNDNGKVSPLKKGKVQLQSEGSEVFYRNIKITAIDRLPADLVN
jgi:hypothetical protein